VVAAERKNLKDDLLTGRCWREAGALGFRSEFLSFEDVGARRHGPSGIFLRLSMLWSGLVVQVMVRQEGFFHVGWCSMQDQWHQTRNNTMTALECSSSELA